MKIHVECEGMQELSNQDPKAPGKLCPILQTVAVQLHAPNLFSTASWLQVLENSLDNQYSNFIFKWLCEVQHLSYCQST